MIIPGAISMIVVKILTGIVLIHTYRIALPKSDEYQESPTYNYYCSWFDIYWYYILLMYTT